MYRERQSKEEDTGSRPEEERYVKSHGKFNQKQEVAVIRGNGAMERGWKLQTYDTKEKVWFAIKDEKVKDNSTGELIPKTLTSNFREDQIGELLDGTPEL